MKFLQTLGAIFIALSLQIFLQGCAAHKKQDENRNLVQRLRRALPFFSDSWEDEAVELLEAEQRAPAHADSDDTELVDEDPEEEYKEGGLRASGLEKQTDRKRSRLAPISRVQPLVYFSPTVSPSAAPTTSPAEQAGAPAGQQESESPSDQPSRPSSSHERQMEEPIIDPDSNDTQQELEEEESDDCTDDESVRQDYIFDEDDAHCEEEHKVVEITIPNECWGGLHLKSTMCGIIIPERLRFRDPFHCAGHPSCKCNDFEIKVGMQFLEMNGRAVDRAGSDSIFLQHQETEEFIYAPSTFKFVHKPTTVFINAARLGKMLTCKSVLDHSDPPVALDAVDLDLRSAIWHASANNHMDLVQFLMGRFNRSNGYCFNRLNPDDMHRFNGSFQAFESVRHVVASANNQKYISIRLSSFNARDRQNISPMMVAAFRGHYGIVKMFLQEIKSKPIFLRADLDSVDAFGEEFAQLVFILTSAAKSGFFLAFEALESLVDFAKTWLSWQESHVFAAKRTRKNNKHIGMMLEHMIIAFRDALISAAGDGCIEVVTLFLSGWLCAAPNNDNVSRFSFSVFLTEFQMGTQTHFYHTEYWRTDIDLIASDQQGQTALSRAAQGGHADVVEYLLRPEFNVLGNSDAGAKSMELAIYYGHEEVVSKLQAAGVKKLDPEQCCSCLENLRYPDRQRYRLVSVTQAEDRGDPNGSKMKSCKCNLVLCSECLPNCADVKGKIVCPSNCGELDVRSLDADGHTAFTRACSEGNEKVAKAIWNLYGTKIDVNHRDHSGSSALFSACKRNNPDMVELLYNLCGEKLDVSVRDTTGWCPIMHVLFQRDLRSFKILCHLSGIPINADDITNPEDVKKMMLGAFMVLAKFRFPEVLAQVVKNQARLLPESPPSSQRYGRQAKWLNRSKKQFNVIINDPSKIERLLLEELKRFAQLSLLEKYRFLVNSGLLSAQSIFSGLRFPQYARERDPEQFKLFSVGLEFEEWSVRLCPHLSPGLWHTKLHDFLFNEVEGTLKRVFLMQFNLFYGLAGSSILGQNLSCKLRALEQSYRRFSSLSASVPAHQTQAARMVVENELKDLEKSYDDARLLFRRNPVYEVITRFHI